MDTFGKYVFETWLKKYSRYVSILAGIGVAIASIFVLPCDAALYLATMHRIYNII